MAAAQFETWIDVNLQAGVRRVAVPEGFFTQDHRANKLGVRVYNGAEPVNLHGGIRWHAKLADGTTVSDDGEIIEYSNMAYAVLKSEAYACVGPIAIAIQNIDDDDKTVLAVFTGYVHETVTDQRVIPGNPVPDIDTLLEEIGNLRDATTAANNIVLVQETQPENATGNKIWVQPQSDEYQVPTWEEFRALDTTADSLGESMTTAEGDIDALETRMTTAEGDIDSLETTTSDHGARLNTAEDDIDAIEGSLSNLKSALHISEHTVTKEITTDVTSTWESGYIDNYGIKTAPHKTYDYSEKISVVAGDVITFGEGNSMRFVCAYDSNDAAVSAKGSSANGTTYTVPDGIVDIVISCAKSNADHRTIHIRRTVSVEEYYVDGQVNPFAFFVSTTGDDDNEGLSASNPKATINSALESGAETILMFGGVYAQTIDLTKCQHPRIRIAAYEKNKKTIIKAPDAVLAESATQVSGYTKVYSATCDKTFNTNNIWIFQEGVADASTEISGTERHPLQRGYQYRCSDTKIAKCSSSVLSDALAEIEAADEYKWYLDDGTLYFSAPSAVSAANPICWSSGTGLFSGNSRGIAIEMIGIDTKYLVVNLNSAMSANIEYCSSGNVYGNGCFTYDGVASARFAHCEAYRGFKGTNGDGFNAHGVTTGDTFAHQTYGLFIDCWGHDNRDDGVSDHERCESAVIGGLYEYNRFGGGVTPSYGSHCTCHGVYCRKNGDGGFIYVDSASEAEGGAGGQLICYDCVAEDNTIWPDRTQSGFKISGNNNRAILVNCKSIGQDYGYYIAESDSYITLIDCGALNCGHATGGHNDNVTKKNTTIVT